MKMLEPSLGQDLLPMELPSMSSQAGSHAKTSVMQESKPEWAKEPAADYGPRLCDLLASYDLSTSSWRTSQHCLLAQAESLADGFAEFLGTWPNAGMMQNGKTYQQQPWARLTLENGRGLLPTQRKNDSQKRGNFDQDNLRNGFPSAVKRLFLPTIGKSEPKGSSSKRFLGSVHFRGAKMSEGLRTCATDPTYLHPSFAEAVMGFPIGWTELQPAEMQSSPKSRNS